jgi:hypothetical protein
VQINILIDIDTIPKPDIVCKTDSDPILDRYNSIQFHYEAVDNSTDANSNDGWDPPEKNKDGLLGNVAESG